MNHSLAAALVAGIFGTGSSTAAQLPARHAAIATAHGVTPATRILTIDVVSGAVRSLSRFSNDDRPPLALRVDPLNRDLLVAVDLGGGVSRILRLGVRGTTVTRTRLLSDLAGRVTDMVVTYPGDLTASVVGAQGGLWHVPRNGGAATLRLAAPRVAAVSIMGVHNTEIWLAESGSGVTPAQLRFVESRSGFVGGPFLLPGIQPPTLTGVAELLTSNPTHVLTTASGEIWHHVLSHSLILMPIAPPLPAGGARAIRKALGNTGFVLGGAAHPFLQSFNAYDTTPQNWNVIAGPFAGDPVAFDISEPPTPEVIVFGERCSPTAIVPSINTQGGSPRLGNAGFGLTTFGTPLIPVILALGTSDQEYLAVPLPVALPGGGCELLVAADVTFAGTTDGRGRAAQAIPLPSDPAMSGRVVFGQWLHLTGGASLAATDAIALHVYP